MTSSKFNINNLGLNLNSLKQDLIFAWEYAKEKHGLSASQDSWISGIDPENMDELKAIYKLCPGTYSLNTLAFEIMRKYKG